ncbi:MAG: exodeoxyribonuclease III [Deltaproteobacteria bacterium]|nr:exodeoxyribonuclease III [Deltaproteobacteria bacterium]
MKMVSWNVNGLKAVQGRNELAWAFQPAGTEGAVDVVCLQETKIQEAHIKPEVRSPPGFARSFFTHHATKKGYSGTAVWVRDGLFAEPFAFTIGGPDHPEYDDEGRICAVDLGELVLINVYFPNGGSSDERLVFKADWHDAFLVAVQQLQKTRVVVVCGDFNIAHRDIDLALPERWAGKHSGALPHERAWFDRLLAAGYVDSFRAEKGDLPRQFTYWETRVDARRENLGWRIDYFVVSTQLEDRLLDAWVSPQIFGSDHCPIGIDLQLKGQTLAAAEWSGELVEEEAEGDDDDGDSRWRR